MIGAMLCAINSAIFTAPAGKGCDQLGQRSPGPLRLEAILGLFSCYLQETFCLRLCSCMMPAARYGIFHLAPDDGDALDELGYALQQQEGERQRDQEFGGIDREAAGIAGLLVLHQRAPEERPSQIRKD